MKVLEVLSRFSFVAFQNKIRANQPVTIVKNFTKPVEKMSYDEFFTFVLYETGSVRLPAFYYVLADAYAKRNTLVNELSKAFREMIKNSRKRLSKQTFLKLKKKIVETLSLDSQKIRIKIEPFKKHSITYPLLKLRTPSHVVAAYYDNIPFLIAKSGRIVRSYIDNSCPVRIFYDRAVLHYPYKFIQYKGKWYALHLIPRRHNIRVAIKDVVSDKIYAQERLSYNVFYKTNFHKTLENAKAFVEKVYLERG